jgi:hypothetical protein
MQLSEFLDEFRCTPINVEIKECIGRADIERFADIVRSAPPCGDRMPGAPILVASGWSEVVWRFRDYTDGAVPTNLPALMHVPRLLRLPNVFSKSGRALQTVYPALVSGESVVRQIHRNGGAVHVFITHFGPWAALDGTDAIDRQAIQKLLDRGVDGIMTDRPCALRLLLDELTNAPAHVRRGRTCRRAMEGRRWSGSRG